jgi:hypothetical protein
MRCVKRRPLTVRDQEGHRSMTKPVKLCCYFDQYVPLQDGQQSAPQFGLIAEEVAKSESALCCQTKKENPTPSASPRLK